MSLFKDFLKAANDVAATVVAEAIVTAEKVAEKMDETGRKLEEKAARTAEKIEQKKADLGERLEQHLNDFADAVERTLEQYDAQRNQPAGAPSTVSEATEEKVAKTKPSIKVPAAKTEEKPTPVAVVVREDESPAKPKARKRPGAGKRSGPKKNAI